MNQLRLCSCWSSYMSHYLWCFLSFFLPSMCTYEHTYENTHICVHLLLRTDNTSCNLQRYCIERRSPIPIRMEGTPPWSLYSIFSCFSAGQSLLFPPNDQTILNVYTMHLRLNGNLCSALARSHSFHSVQMSFSDLLFLPWSSLGLFPRHLSYLLYYHNPTQDPFRTVLERVASALRQRGIIVKEMYSINSWKE